MPNSENCPQTVFVLGAGCSVGQGIPTLFNFLDRGIEKLVQGGRDVKYHLENLKNFLSQVRAAGAYMNLPLLNIEEVYGIVDMAADVEENSALAEEAANALKARSALDCMIFEVCKQGGLDILDHKEKYPFSDDDISQIKRNSNTEEIQAFDQGGPFTNILAHICLWTYKDNSGAPPLFVIFNWDATLDRVTFFLDGNDNFTEFAEKAYFHVNGADFHSRPKIARPHGGIFWWKATETPPPGSLKIGESEENGKDVYAVPFLNKDLSLNAEMAIAPPTWRKHATMEAFRIQWKAIKQALQNARQIIFIGYSFPRSDLHFRNFIAYALANNPYSPKVYAWNPGIISQNTPEKKQLRENYRDAFHPLLRQQRLFGIDIPFGSPALLDPARALRIAELLSETE